MRALVWEAPRSMVIREQAQPQPAPDEVLIHVSYAGICGSELSGYLGHNALRVPPLVMGHEFAGRLAALGADVAAHRPDLRVGGAVTVNPLVTCGTCDVCRAGAPHLCAQRRLIGAHRPGAYAEYVAVPASTTIALPPDVSDRTGALAEPVAVAVHIAQVAGNVQNCAVLVVGAGPIGLLALQTLRMRGAGPVFVSDIAPERLEMAAELGAEALDARSTDVPAAVRAALGGRGVAVSVDAVGTTATRAACIAATQSGGAVVLSGLHEETGPIPAADVIRRELVLRGSFCYTHADFAEAVELLRTHTVRLDPWIVESPLDEGGAWFERLLGNPGPVSKVLLRP